LTFRMASMDVSGIIPKLENRLIHSVLGLAVETYMRLVNERASICQIPINWI